jgi:hypothetical protein
LNGCSIERKKNMKKFIIGALFLASALPMAGCKQHAASKPSATPAVTTKPKDTGASVHTSNRPIPKATGIASQPGKAEAGVHGKTTGQSSTKTR